MPATISAAGTWTTLRTPTTGNTVTGYGGQPVLLAINPLDFTGGSAQGMAVLPDELNQFVTIAASAWGLSFWSTVTLINAMLQSIQNRGAPAQYAVA